MTQEVMGRDPTFRVPLTQIWDQQNLMVDQEWAETKTAYVRFAHVANMSRSDVNILQGRESVVDHEDKTWHALNKSLIRCQVSGIDILSLQNWFPE